MARTPAYKHPDDPLASAIRIEYPPVMSAFDVQRCLGGKSEGYVRKLAASGRIARISDGYDRESLIDHLMRERAITPNWDSATAGRAS